MRKCLRDARTAGTLSGMPERGEFAGLQVEMRTGFATMASGMGDITHLLQPRDDG